MHEHFNRAFLLRKDFRRHALVERAKHQSKRVLEILIALVELIGRSLDHSVDVEITESEVSLILRRDEKRLVLRGIQHLDKGVEITVVVAKPRPEFPEPFISNDVNHLIANHFPKRFHKWIV
jgi:hypothetical protein